MNSNPLPLPMLALLGVGIMLVGGIGPNFLLAALATMVLLTFFVALWRPGETPVLLFIMLLQWLQASIKIFYANWLGVGLNEVAEFGGNISLAVTYSLISLFVLTLGIRLGQGAISTDLAWKTREVSLKYPLKMWLRWYWIALLVSLVSVELAGSVPALSQPLLALAQLKWAFFFMLGYVVLINGGLGKGLFLLIIAFEFLLGFGSYFSDFKTVFLVTAMAVLTAGIRIRPGSLLTILVVGAVTVYMSILWSAVKVEYRKFVSGGESAQVVSVDYTERVKKLLEMIDEIDKTQFQEGTDAFISRLSYVDFFGLVLENVPEAVPHTEGAIWLDAIVRPFMPRVFFPGKTEIHDSERTSLYSGRQSYGAERGVSISIGYIGESYIDFGAKGMILPLLAFGYLIGRTYRWMVVTGPLRGLLGMGVATASLLTFSFLESSITKSFGGFVAAILVIWLFGKFVAPRYLPWLLQPRA